MNELIPPNQARVERENIALARKEGRPLRPVDFYLVQVRDQHWEGDLVEIEDPVPTGRQILTGASKSPAENYVLLMLDKNGLLDEVNLDEPVDVYRRGIEQFIAFESDRLFYVELNGRRFPWGQSRIQEDVLRQVGAIPDDEAIWLERRTGPDQLLAEGESVDLGEDGLERLYTQPKCWRLNVQGVNVKSEMPTILASDALESAGFNPDKGWILVLKVRGEPKQSIEMSDFIDLRKPGIEKLRLTPAEINNGEAAPPSALEFSLLEKDAEYLNKLGICWETRVDGARRWLIIHDYGLPPGYDHKRVEMAIEIPASYPEAKLDMFYVFPCVKLANGGGIGQTESRETIIGKVYQRWSRHLNGATRWNPLTDSVITHLAVVEESLLREVGQ